jgi:putative flippase GtrA
MQNDHSVPSSISILGGTCLVIFNVINQSGIIQTIIYAAIGSAVSFMVTYLLKYLVNKKKNDTG